MVPGGAPIGAPNPVPNAFPQPAVYQPPAGDPNSFQPAVAPNGFQPAGFPPQPTGVPPVNNPQPTGVPPVNNPAPALVLEDKMKKAARIYKITNQESQARSELRKEH